MENEEIKKRAKFISEREDFLAHDIWINYLTMLRKSRQFPILENKIRVHWEWIKKLDHADLFDFIMTHMELDLLHYEMMYERQKRKKNDLLQGMF